MCQRNVRIPGIQNYIVGVLQYARVWM